MNAFERSWTILKLSIEVMKKDKEVLAFPLLAGVFSIVFILAMLLPTALTILRMHSLTGTTLLFWLLLGLTYLGLAFIATFFNVCVVYTVKKRLAGGNATFSESINFAFSRIHLIFAWSLLSATVGLILRILDNIAQRSQGIGRILLQILTAGLGMMWSIITLFVIPAMVYKNVGPIDAITSSVATLKKTWGESLIRYFGLGIMQIIFVIIGVVLGVVLLLTTAGNLAAFLIVLALVVLYFLALAVFFSLANTIFNTILYEYAATGKVPKGCDERIVKQAFIRSK